MKRANEKAPAPRLGAMTTEQLRHLELWQRRSSPAAVEELIESIKGGIHKLTVRFSFMSGISKEDLEGECRIAIVRWLDKWKPEENQRLFGFLYQRMKWHLMLYTKETQSAIRIPVSAFDNGHRAARICSIEAPIRTGAGETPKRISDIITDESEASALDNVLRAENIAAVRQAMQGLGERDRFILELRSQDETLEQIGQKLGLSRERIRQLEERALDKLRKKLRLIWSMPKRRPVKRPRQKKTAVLLPDIKPVVQVSAATSKPLQVKAVSPAPALPRSNTLFI